MNSAREVLRRGFGGDIIEPGAAEYASASRSLFASGSPAYVLRPDTVGDVQAAVRFATRAGLVLSVRGGGHGFPGFATNDGGVVIDLGNLATVEVIDTARHVVRIGGGATWGQVTAGLAPHRLAISGATPTASGSAASPCPAASAGRSASMAWPSTRSSPPTWSSPTAPLCT